MAKKENGKKGGKGKGPWPPIMGPIYYGPYSLGELGGYLPVTSEPQWAGRLKQGGAARSVSTVSAPRGRTHSTESRRCMRLCPESVRFSFGEPPSYRFSWLYRYYEKLTKGK